MKITLTRTALAAMLAGTVALAGCTSPSDAETTGVKVEAGV